MPPPFAVKDWKNAPDHSTPLNASSLEDLEKRVTDYAATSGGPMGPIGATGVKGDTGPAGPAGIGANFRGPYSNVTAYALNDASLASDGNWYISLQNANTGHDPSLQPANAAYWSNINGPNVSTIFDQRVQRRSISIDLCNAWTDGVTTYAAMADGNDVTVVLQAAINFITQNVGAPSGYGGIANPTVAASGEIYFSKPGVYHIDGVVKTATIAGNVYNAQVIFPGILGLNRGCSIHIRGLEKHIWSGGSNQPGVVLTSTVANADIFAVAASGSGTYPDLSHILVQFSDIMLFNTVATGGNIDAFNAGGIQLHRCLFYNSGSGSLGVNSTRTGVKFPHGIQNGDMVVNNCGFGGYLTGIQVSEHVVFEGWNSWSGCQNAISFTGAGHVANLGHCWMTGCPTILNATAVGAICHIRGLIDWEGGGLTASGARLTNDPTGKLVGKIIINHSDMNQWSGGSLCGVLGSIASNQGSALDIEMASGGASWRASHPQDIFARKVLGTGIADYPGYCSENWAPWRVGSGATILSPFWYVKTWVSSTTYSATDYILGSDNVSYISMQAGNLNHDPSLSANQNVWWKPAGVLANSVSTQGNWGGLVNYKVGQVVRGSDSVIYHAVQDNTNQDPTLDATHVYWVVGGTGASAYVPVQQASTGGLSRSITAKIILGASWTGFNVQAQKNIGGTGAGKLVSITVGASNITMAVSTAGTVATYTPPAGVVAANTAMTITLTIIIAPDGLPSRIRGYINGLPKLSYRLTDADRNQFFVGTKWPSFEDGVQWTASDTNTIVTEFTVRDVVEDSFVPRTILATGTIDNTTHTYTPDAEAGMVCTVSNADAPAQNITINTPVNPPGNEGQELIIEVTNSTGATMTGTLAFQVTGSNSFKLPTGTAIVAPSGSAKKRWYRFFWNNVNWVFLGQAGGDY